jgi:predicted DNA-binding transcriptional regulator YafY
LEAIVEGWGTGHKVQITYSPPTGEDARERIIAPYTLEPTDAGVYVIGHDETSGEIRTFKIERLSSAHVLPLPYKIPDEFDPVAFLKDSWRIMTGEEPVSVSLRFCPEAAPYVRERTWHASQDIKAEPDGGLILHLCIAEPREMLLIRQLGRPGRGACTGLAARARGGGTPQRGRVVRAGVCRWPLPDASR